VVFLTEHSKSGSRGLLMERRTGALMGDVSMEEYGCVAISPLWLGGTVLPRKRALCLNGPAC
jgi:putative AlgH/UPF0301 family transcriptional regulator